MSHMDGEPHEVGDYPDVPMLNDLIKDPNLEHDSRDGFIETQMDSRFVLATHGASLALGSGLSHEGVSRDVFFMLECHPVNLDCDDVETLIFTFEPDEFRDLVGIMSQYVEEEL